MTARPGADDESFAWLPEVLHRYGWEQGAQPVMRVRIGTPWGAISGLRWGDERPRLLLLHGGGQNAHTWDVVAAMLGEPALALDLPGHGHSDWRPDHDYTPSRSAVSIAAALDAIGMRPDAVIGMSLGGLTATSLLGARKDLVPALTLVDILPDLPHGRDRAPADRGQVALLDGPSTFDSLEDMVEAAVRASPNRSVHDLRRGVVHNSTTTGDGRYRWRYDDIRSVRRSSEGLWPALRDRSVPLLLVRAGENSFVPDDALRAFRSARPDAEVVTVGGATHAVQSTEPACLTELIRRFVSTSRRRSDESETTIAEE